MSCITLIEIIWFLFATKGPTFLNYQEKKNLKYLADTGVIKEAEF